MIAARVGKLRSTRGLLLTKSPFHGVNLNSPRSFFWSSKPKEISTQAIDSSVPVNTTNDPPAATTSNISHNTVTNSNASTDAATEAVSNPHLQNVLESTTEPLKYGDLANLGLCNRWYGFIQQALEAVHVSTGLPWWATITLTTVSLRLALFPLLRNALINTSKMAVFQPEMQSKMQAMTAAKKAGKDQEAAVIGQEVRMFMKENNLKPLRGLVLPLVQMPLFIAFYFGLDDMARLPVKQLAEGGIGWIKDLTVPDKTFILPIISSSLMFKSISMGPDGSGSVQSPQAQRMKPFFQLGSFIIVPMSWWLEMPSAVFIYWCTTNAFSLAQSYALSSTSVRKSLGLPSLETIAENNRRSFPQQYQSQEKAPGFIESMKSSYNTFRDDFEERKKPMIEAQKQREKEQRERLLKQTYESERSDKGLYESSDLPDSLEAANKTQQKSPLEIKMEEEKRERALKNEQQRLARFKRNTKRHSRY